MVVNINVLKHNLLSEVSLDLTSFRYYCMGFFLAWKSSGAVLSTEKMFVKIFKNSKKNIVVGVSLFIKLQAENLKVSEATTGDVL